jgi:hypothetical protein
VVSIDQKIADVEWPVLKSHPDMSSLQIIKILSHTFSFFTAVMGIWLDLQVHAHPILIGLILAATLGLARL